MKIVLNSAINTTKSYQVNKQKPKNTMNITSPMQNKSSQVAFKGWWSDMTYYFAKKLEDKREEKKEAQFEQVRKLINDDVKFIAERQGLSLEAAKQRYEDNIDMVSIPLKYNGREEGLNKVIGYSVEKYKAMMEVVLPLMADKESNFEFPVPNGVLLYGPPHTGKTHIAKALGEHIRIKDVGNFREVEICTDEKNSDNPVPLLKEFEWAEERYKETGERQILFFDDIDLNVLDEETPNIAGVFIAKTKNCAKNGVTWVATTNNPDDLPDTIYKPFRLNSDIFINKMSAGEKSAVMSYFWTKHDRKDESDHDAILDKNRTTGFHFYPPEVEDVSGRVNYDLMQNHDKKSTWNSRITVRKPVKTDNINTHIGNYLNNRKANKKTDADMAYAITSQSYGEYVAKKRARYENKTK